jgi:hypothetical protein
LFLASQEAWRVISLGDLSSCEVELFKIEIYGKGYLLDMDSRFDGILSSNYLIVGDSIWCNEQCLKLKSFQKLQISFAYRSGLVAAPCWRSNESKYRGIGFRSGSLGTMHGFTDLIQIQLISS